MTNKEAAIWLLNLRADIGKSQYSELWHYEQALQEIQESLESDVPDRKVGKWLEKEVIHAEEAKEVITEWQSCKCSVCGRYHTEPYMYFFLEPSFCSWCGADMRGEADG